MYNDELTALQWALNSAVECHLHVSSLFNTFNNLTRLTGTAKYRIVRTRQNLSGCGCGYSSALDFLFCRHRASRVAYKAGSRARGTVNATDGADLAC